MRQRTDLEGQLLELQGKTNEIRQRELAELDPSNRALQQRIYQLQDEQAAAEKASAIASERADLERQILQLEGNTKALREEELAALDPGNRELQKRIYALQDEAAAAQAAAAVANERAGLEKQLLEAQGDTAAIRKLELAALDPSNRAIQKQIWALQDQAAATEAAAQAASQAAAKEQAIANERVGLEQQLLETNVNFNAKLDAAILRIKVLEDCRTRREGALGAADWLIKSPVIGWLAAIGAALFALWNGGRL